MQPNKKIHIFGGGTMTHVRNHLSLCAPAYGTTAYKLTNLFEELLWTGAFGRMDVVLNLTKMAERSSKLVTNRDVSDRVDELIADLTTKIIVFSCALVDFEGHLKNTHIDGERGPHGARLDSEFNYSLNLRRAPKVIQKIRKERKDILLVGFKTTTGATSDEQFQKGLKLMKTSSCNLVLANDVVTRNNMIITPEEVRYHETKNRDKVLAKLAEMALLRSQLTFTRSTVIDGEPYPWDGQLVPDNLREIVNYCIEQGAYKTGPTGATVGHFACKLGPTRFLTSRRKQNYNRLDEVGLVEIRTDGPDSVLAYGSKPSVGGQSQRIVFDEHEGYDCIVHFHCPLKPDHEDTIPTVSQREYECGSHECGQNTSTGLQRVYGEIKAVMLDKHGPNIVFKKTTPAWEVIKFIERNFDLEKKTT